jgi:hypothetical protein
MRFHVNSNFKRSEEDIPSFEACKGFHVDPLNELLHLYVITTTVLSL